MKKVVVGLLLVCSIVQAQNENGREIKDVFRGYDSYRVDHYEEGAVHMWQWRNGGYIMLLDGAMGDLAFPQGYRISDDSDLQNIRAIKIIDKSKMLFARKEVFRRQHIMSMYFNFQDTIAMDSLAGVLANYIQSGTRQ